MEMKILESRTLQIDVDGEYPFQLSRNESFNTIEARWVSEDIPPAGILECAVDGDPGVVPGVMDLSTTGNAGSRVLVVNGYLNGLTITATGLPDGGSVLVKLNG